MKLMRESNLEDNDCVRGTLLLRLEMGPDFAALLPEHRRQQCVQLIGGTRRDAARAQSAHVIDD